MPAPSSFLSLLTGSFSTPAAGNPTVAMIEAAYRHHDLDARYINCEVSADALGDAVRGARAMGWVGFNCSLPHKVAVIAHLDGLGDSAALIGAVNTVVRRDGRYVGENTDGQGFLSALGQAAGESFVVLGAGGAARAIAVEAALAGAATITIVNRDPGRGSELVALLEQSTPSRADLVVWDGTYRVPPATSVLVNATSVGLFPDLDGRLDLDPATLQPRMIVADVIPNPPRTRLIREAEARGCRVVDGIGMLVGQGALAIRHWTGVEPDQGVMRGELERVLGV